MALRWTAHTLTTGAYRDDVAITVSDIEQSVGEASTTTGTLAEVQAPAQWQTVLNPATAMLVVTDRHEGVALPLLGYYIRAVVGPDKQQLTYTLGSLETIVAATAVDDAEFTGVDTALVVKALLEQRLVPKWGFVVDATPTGVLVDRYYDATERTTIGDALTDLATQGDLEWTVRMRWSDDDEQDVTKVIVIGPRVGGDQPNTVLDNGAVDQAVPTLDCADGRLAVRVKTVSTDGDESTWHEDTTSLANGVPPWEAVVEVTIPDTPVGRPDIDPQTYLEQVAAKLLRVKSAGLRTWDLEINAAHLAALRPGRDFVAGDSVQVPALGVDGLMRMVGWKASIGGGDIRTLTPIVYDNREEPSLPSDRRDLRDGNAMGKQERAFIRGRIRSLSAQSATTTRRLDQSQGTA